MDYKQGLKIWSIYFGTIFISLVTHEIGHCIPAWINGYSAIPTPMKEYISGTVPGQLQQFISLGGILGTIFISLTVLMIYLVRPDSFSAALLAAAIAMPGAYTLRFLLMGRGHDATEFQEAQSAMGLSYSGHFIDYLFLVIFLAGVIFWIIKSRPVFKILTRLIPGFILTIIFIAGLQWLNNYVFDPLFQH